MTSDRPHDNGKRICVAPDCEKPVHRHSRECSMHAWRRRKHGSYDLPPERLCEVAGCGEKHYGKGLCQKHYWRLQRHGSPDLPAKHEQERPVCVVDGCDRIVGPKSARGMCDSHYSRVRYGQPIDGPFRKYGESHVNPEGYRQIHIVGHPLARKSGYVLEHRAVAFDKYGDGAQTCHWCHEDLGEWSPRVHVDHIDGDRLNNHPDNLVTACGGCNTARAFKGNPATFGGWR